MIIQDGRLIIHRIGKINNNIRVNSNVREHQPHNRGLMLFTWTFLNPLSPFDSDNQDDRLGIKRRERPYPVMPIQMAKQYAEMSVVRKQQGYILVCTNPGI